MFKHIEDLQADVKQVADSVNSLRLEMAKDGVRRAEVDELWRKHESNATQIAHLQKFKTQAIAIGLTLNFLLGIALALVAIFKK